MANLIAYKGHILKWSSFAAKLWWTENKKKSYAKSRQPKKNQLVARKKDRSERAFVK